ncbi:NAD(P)/FAD-dependent oxidoreductase [Desulfuromonas thiophila]|uniref:Nitrite/Sulfite reductase ferredoxin-like half domain-containing protein n=1 Tax=Desulfuromonas thiophila TaxID=57664 RepID=A0A1G7CP75_9BACT|nr:NAD(P)/FAD-dependent oxidoreductase [Desulfuromonas thiophila]MDD3802518.1 NAD(P)/FAD-dependent oxidoreductase [Desulfuromonas thiophila]MDY0397857.1 NAD(P)/FAD-dependent oxidoreductase [Desulfuromonas thiophila]SDE41127.1 Nitrite/Sulfite reductase ferredoxin-like half domain-containing protein [Desulfuromonas thiophila]
MKKDLLEKGAVLQRDKETYAVAPHIPGGITNPAQLRKIADVAEKYQAQALKITSAQRIAIVGLPEDQLDAIWADLDEPAGAAIGMCVRSVKICPGTTFCKRGQQDSVSLGLELDKRYHGMELPWKFKMGVSGCANDCAEVCIKDVGLIGTPKGWKVCVGGNGGAGARLSAALSEGLDDQQALALLDHIVQWFVKNNRKGRLGKFVEEMGFEAFQKEILDSFGG